MSAKFMRRIKNKKRPETGWQRLGRGFGTALNVAQKAGTALRIASKVAAMLNVEYKSKDTYLANVTTSTPTIACMSAIDAGTSDNQRTGKVIKAASNSLKYDIYLNTTLPTECAIRIILFIDKVSNNAIPLEADLLDTTAGAPSLVCHYNKQNCSARFRILYDKVHTLDPNQKRVGHFSTYDKLSHHLNYSNLGATVSALETGQVYLYMVSDAPTSGTAPMVKYCNRFNFIDN